jgi:hypothetical protein
MQQTARASALAALLALTLPFAPATSLAEDSRPEFKGCKLGDVTGAGMTIRSYACGKKLMNAHLEVDEALPGFDYVDSSGKGMRIRAFKKEPGAPIDAVLTAVRAASPGVYSGECVFEPLEIEDYGRPTFVLTPAGKGKTAWDEAQDDTSDMEPPCGTLGVHFEGDRYFQELSGDPSTVVFINAGSEIQIYDPRTLKAAKAK